MQIVFDFDKTLTGRDVFTSYLIFTLKNNFSIKFLFILFKNIIFFKFNLINNSQFKYNLLSYIHTLMDVNISFKLFNVNANFEKHLNMTAHYLNLTKPSDVYVVSASPYELVKYYIDVKVFATDIDVRGSKVYIQNLFSNKKVDILKRVPLLPDVAFSDSLSDKPLFDLSKKGYLIKNSMVVKIYE